MKNMVVGFMITLVLLGSFAFGKTGKVTSWPVETKAIDAKYTEKAQELINGGIEFLLSQRNINGGWWIGEPKADRKSVV